MGVVIIVAVASNRAIGRNNELPWRLPEDLRRFKQLTMGHPIVMGRRTWDSLPRQPLPGRTNIVVTRDPDFRAEHALVAGSIQDALQAAQRAPGPDAVFVIGGAQVYEQALPLARRLEVTEVHQAVDGDVFFPAIDPEQWREVSREPHTAADGLCFDFVRYERRG
jgi:dihydrofolate reductase